MRAYLSPVECDAVSQFMCADQAKCVDIRFCCESNHFSDSGEGSEEKNCNITLIQVRLRVLWCVGAGVVECLKEWRRTVVGLEVCGRGVCVWESWRCVGRV